MGMHPLCSYVCSHIHRISLHTVHCVYTMPPANSANHMMILCIHITQTIMAAMSKCHDRGETTSVKLPSVHNYVSPKLAPVLCKGTSVECGTGPPTSATPVWGTGGGNCE